jgi:uncharacterized protein YejL (UPF0352 family)
MYIADTYSTQQATLEKNISTSDLSTSLLGNPNTNTVNATQSLTKEKAA